MEEYSQGSKIELRPIARISRREVHGTKSRGWV